MREGRRPAPAKVNLVLEVTGRREDDYHDLRSVMQTLELADDVAVSFDGPGGVTVTGPFAAGTPADESNLAWRAATELAARTGNDVHDLHIAIEKRIPAAGGLGGGASDAVATLHLVAEARGIDDERLLMEAANAIGSDEAFFLRGGTALVEGRGEVVRPLPALPAHDVVLFVPRETLEQKTATLFAALAKTPFDTGERTEAFLALHPRAITVDDTYNAFERVAFEVFPGLGALREAIQRAIGAPVRLAGAGPTLFWIGPSGNGAAIATKGRGLPCELIATRTAP